MDEMGCARLYELSSESRDTDERGRDAVPPASPASARTGGPHAGRVPESEDDAGVLLRWIERPLSLWYRKHPPWRRSSAGQSSGIIIRVSEVRVLSPLPPYVVACTSVQ